MESTNRKIVPRSLFAGTEWRQRHEEQTRGLIARRGEGGANREGFTEIHALLSFKETASGKLEVMEFQLSCFQVLKDDAVKVLLSICQQIWKA